MPVRLLLAIGLMIMTPTLATRTPPLPEIPPIHQPPTSSLNQTSTLPSVRWIGHQEPLRSKQWNLDQIQAQQAWKLTQKEITKAPKLFQPVTIAVLDTGFIASPELTKRVINGYDFVSNPNTSGDGNGRDADATAEGEVAYHGEVVANIIAAANNGQGMAGINPSAKIVHVRVADTNGEVQVQDLIDGIRWAAGLPVKGVPQNPNPAKILNLSLYADFIPLTHCDPQIQAALSEIYLKKVLVVAGAANDNANAKGYSPAGCRHVITVTAVNQKKTRPTYANWGLAVHLAAPGGDTSQPLITASQHNQARFKGHPIRRDQGTSFSAPHVTGAASLILSFRPNLHPILVKNLLTSTSQAFPEGRCDPLSYKTCGRGILNAHKALSKALASPLGK